MSSSGILTLACGAVGISGKGAKRPSQFRGAPPPFPRHGHAATLQREIAAGHERYRIRRDYLPLPDAVHGDVLQAHADRVLRIQSQKCRPSRRDAVDILQHDVAIIGQLVAVERGVHGGQHDGVLHVAHADVLVRHILHQAAAAAIAFDADSVVRPVDAEVAHAHVVHAAIGIAADRHAVSRVEMIVRDGHVGGRSGGSGLDRHVVVARIDIAMDDGDVGGRRRVDAVRVARGLRRLDLDAPRREAVGALHRDVEVRRIAQGDAIEREVVALPHDQEAGHALREILDLRLFGQIPPGDVEAQQGRAAASVDGAIAHDAAARRLLREEERLAPAAALIDDAAASGRQIVVARIA